MGKINLDKVFQKKLKDFKPMPDESVWQNIEASLDEKKKDRKIIPIWWRLGGAAAAVIIMALLFVNPFKNKTIESSVISNTDSKSTKKSKASENSNAPSTIDFKNTEPKNEIVDTEKVKGKIGPKSIKKQVNYAVEEKQNKTYTTQQSNSITGKQKASLASQNQIAVASNKNTVVKEKHLNHSDELITDVKSKKQKNIEQITSNALAVNSNQKSEKIKNNRTAEQALPNLLNASQEINTIKDDSTTLASKDEKKKSIFDVIEAQENEKLASTNPSDAKWSVGPSIAPVYFNSLNEGSPISQDFVSNAKSGEIKLSYGITLAYEINPKLSVKSGVHKVDYGFVTNNVGISSAANAVSSRENDNIDYSTSSQNIIITSGTSSDSSLSATDVISEITTDIPTNSGQLEQQFGYIEVPLELKYALVNKRFGLSFIGGLSSLFLTDNSLAVNSRAQNTDIGEATNLNSVNFSTNFGLGVHYNFTPKLKLNFEPVFKYQLNTFSSSAGSFKPYSVGVYTGLSLKF